MRRVIALALGTALAIGGSAALAQDGGAAPAAAPPAVPAAAPAAAPAPSPFLATPLGAGPWDYQTEKNKIHVEVVTKGLDHPWGMAFLPNGDMLVTERPGRLRIVSKAGVLDPTPIAGLPAIFAQGIAGLMDVALHPQFAKNRLIYVTYTKPSPTDPKSTTLAVMRAKWDGSHQLTDVKDIFVADTWYGQDPLPQRCCGQGPPTGSYGGRMAFDGDGFLFVTSGDRNYGEMVQKTDNDFGKILRLNDDGSIPKDNPYVGDKDYKPEIWTIGHRNPTGLTIDPEFGEMWETEFGPHGGDEVNRIQRGANYGWIDVTQGQHYDKTPAKGVKGVSGMTDPLIVWLPESANPGNLTFYHGKRLPGWDGSLFIAMMSKSLIRAEIGANGDPSGKQEKLLEDLKQRLRDVRQGPDGNLYVLTDEKDGALLRIAPGK
ncbi:MAG: PQQ-dependent sugar dehydrogenase [Candidatus Andeanibacterium colombiense]|uniref:PQQ-dependent sugar dehydrogenase n=1 Tax=Candidatus Andeanibacterium colombiense TaxID=3121345 RepID=A0AAJ5X3G1_9SPHN|nr:MAG: PQQ-dependent sugar dehydrogenase [Sphingomonadaceae bacterium]